MCHGIEQLLTLALIKAEITLPKLLAKAQCIHCIQCAQCIKLWLQFPYSLMAAVSGCSFVAVAVDIANAEMPQIWLIAVAAITPYSFFTVVAVAVAVFAVSRSVRSCL